MSDLRFPSTDGIFELRAAGIIVRRPTADPADSRLLMITNAQDAYAYSIGGAVMFGETMREAAAREVLEETGTPLPIGDLAAVEQTMFTDGDGRPWHVVTHHYWVDVPDDFVPAERSVGFEAAEETLHWLSAHDLEHMTFYPACYADATVARWSGVRYFMERGGQVTEPET